jgi:ribose transport system permease protein
MVVHRLWGGEVMRTLSRRLVTDYGMLLILLAVGVIFSVLTIQEQPAAGATAVRRQVATIERLTPPGGRVLVAVRDVPADRQLAETLGRRLEVAGFTVVSCVQGEPQQIRQSLEEIVAAGGRVDAVAATERTGSWLVLTEMGDLFPSLGQPPIVVAEGVLWPTFLRRENLLNIANQIAVIAIMAVGMTMVIITGGIDLSVGSLAALAAVSATVAIRDLGGGTEASVPGMVSACLLAILLCGFAGGVSGGLITLCDLPPFIVTLAVMLVASGTAAILSGGESIYQVPESFVWLGRGSGLFGLPHAVVLMGLLYTAAHGLLTRTTLGRCLLAVGGNREAARLSGVPVRRVLLFAYASSGLLAGLGGVIMASQLRSGSPNYGAMYELSVIAAVVVGGTSLSGGQGSVFGTLIGALIIAVIQNGMNLTNIESYTQKVVLGCVILAAVLADRFRQRVGGMMARAAESAR